MLADGLPGDSSAVLEHESTMSHNGPLSRRCWTIKQGLGFRARVLLYGTEDMCPHEHLAVIGLIVIHCGP